MVIYLVYLRGIISNLEVELLEMARRVETALHEKELFHKYSKAMEELIKEKDEAIERLKKIYEPSQLKDTPSEKTSVIRVNNQTFSKKGRIRKYIERWRIKKEEKEILELIRDPELTEEQTEFLLKARQEGMQLEKIRHLAIPGISVQRMEQMKIYMMEDKNETIRRKNS